MIKRNFMPGLVPAGLAVAGFVALAGCSSSTYHPMAQSNSVAPAAAPAPVAVANPEVSPGTIKQIQTALKQQGLYNGHIDGVWGPQTQNAIHGYQQSHNLTDNGELDSPTLTSLKIASVGSAAPMAMAPATPMASAPATPVAAGPAPSASTTN